MSKKTTPTIQRDALNEMEQAQETATTDANVLPPSLTPEHVLQL